MFFGFGQTDTPTDWCRQNCEGCCSMNDISTILKLISCVKRAGIVIVLYCFVLYYIPETRSPTRKGCTFLIDLTADGLKFLVNSLDNCNEFVDSIDRRVSKRLGKLISTSYDFTKMDTSFRYLDKKFQPYFSYNIADAEVLRYYRNKQRVPQHKQDLYKQIQLKKNQSEPESRTMKFKEKSTAEKVGPISLMQRDTFLHQTSTEITEKAVEKNISNSPCLSSFKKDDDTNTYELKSNSSKVNLNKELWIKSEVEISKWSLSESEEEDATKHDIATQSDATHNPTPLLNHLNNQDIKKPNVEQALSFSCTTFNCSQDEHSQFITKQKAYLKDNSMRTHRPTNDDVNEIKKYSDMLVENKEYTSDHAESQIYLIKAPSPVTDNTNESTESLTGTYNPDYDNLNESKTSICSAEDTKLDFIKSSLLQTFEWFFGSNPNRNQNTNVQVTTKLSGIVRKNLPNYFE